MYCVRNVTEDLYWIGANDHRLSLFENIHPIPEGVSYNAYVLMDEKTVLLIPSIGPPAVSFLRIWNMFSTGVLWIIWSLTIWSRITALPSRKCFSAIRM